MMSSKRNFHVETNKLFGIGIAADLHRFDRPGISE
jgi:hypothetical protein